MKWRGSAEGPAANAADLIALRFARAAGIPVPSPRILRLTEASLDPAIDPELNDLIRRSIGTNLGIDEVAEFTPYERSHRESVPADLRSLVFAFDVLFLNMDRTESNPNMVMTPAGLLCWDFAAAMELRMAVEGRSIDEQRFYPLLRQHPFFVGTAADRPPWPAIDENVIEEFLADLPADWLPAGIDAAGVRTRLATLLANAEATIRRRTEAIAQISVETADDRAARTSANRRAFEEAVARLANRPGPS